VRALVVKKYFNGHKPIDKEIAAVYDHWGKTLVGNVHHVRWVR
jgi:hypothetical protein